MLTTLLLLSLVHCFQMTLSATLPQNQKSLLRPLEYRREARCPGYPHCLCGPGRFSTYSSLYSRLGELHGSPRQLHDILTCKSCPAGKFSDGMRNEACKLCPVGRFSTGNAKSVLCDGPCKPGRYGERGERSEVCTDICAPGRYCPVGITDMQAGLACPAGRYGLGGSTASICSGLCAPGKYSIAGATVCSLCPAGRFSSESGKIVCDKCSAGKTSPSTGPRTLCKACKVGRFAKAGMPYCLACTVGWYAASTGAARCSACPPGKFSNVNGRQKCTSCTLGQYSKDLGNVKCKQCPLGQLATLASARCSPCPIGRFDKRDFALRACLGECPPGEYCPRRGFTAGTLINNRVVQAGIPCPPGRYSTGAAGTPACQGLCRPGQFSKSNSSHCSSCGPGHFAPVHGAGSCERCHAGKFSAAIGVTICVSCKPGWHQKFVGKTRCSICSPGRYSNSYGLTICKRCMPGFFQPSTGSTHCKACPPGHYTVPSRAILCFPCPPGFFQPHILTTNKRLAKSALFTAHRCKPCARGRFAANSAAEVCNFCPPGRSTDGIGSRQCMACAPGRAPAKREDLHNDVGCVRCAPGRFARFSGSHICHQCNGHTMTLPKGGATACTRCPHGQYQKNATACVPVRNSPAPTPLAPLVNQVELSRRVSGWSVSRQFSPRAHLSTGFMPKLQGAAAGSLIHTMTLASVVVFCLWLSCTILCTFPAELARRRRVLISPDSQKASTVVTENQQVAQLERTGWEETKILAGGQAPIYLAREPQHDVASM